MMGFVALAEICSLDWISAINFSIIGVNFKHMALNEAIRGYGHLEFWGGFGEYSLSNRGNDHDTTGGPTAERMSCRVLSFDRQKERREPDNFFVNIMRIIFYIFCYQ